MNCDMRQRCNMCYGDFAMTRGCNLEKRCPACRILGSSKKDNLPIGNELYMEYIHGKGEYYKEASEFIEKTDILADLNDCIYPDSELNEYRHELNSAISAIFHEVLTQREREVLSLRFNLIDEFSDPTLKEIGKTLGISPERVRQIESNGMRKLKHPRICRKLINHII